MTLTLAQSATVVSLTTAAWLMVRAGYATKRLHTKTYRVCAACGRRLGRARCHCSD